MNDPRAIVVVCPSLIGDTVMATPTLRALRQRFPEARIDGVVRPGVAPTLAGAPWFDALIPFHPRGKDPAHRTLPFLRRLKAGRYDLAVLLPNSFRPAALTWLARIPRRVGYVRYGRGALLTDRLVPPSAPSRRRLPSPMIDYYLALARHLGCPVDSLRTELFTVESEEQAADQAWERLGLNGVGRVVCLNNGGAFGPAKSWPTEYFAILAKRLAVETGVGVLVVCGPDEQDAARAVVAQADHPRVVSLADEPLSIGLTKASIRRSALLVTTDSGPRHFAGAFGVPVVSLFGPTFIAWTRTYHPHAIHLQQPVPCGPCQKGVCPLGHHRCMRELDPRSVFNAALRLLGGSSVPSR